MKKIKLFLIGLRKEVNKIRWPKKKELIKSSVATCFCVIILALFFTGLDFIFSTVMKWGA